MFQLQKIENSLEYMCEITAVERYNGLLAITSATKKISNKDIIGITAEHIMLKKIDDNVMILTDEVNMIITNNKNNILTHICTIYIPVVGLFPKVSVKLICMI